MATKTVSYFAAGDTSVGFTPLRPRLIPRQPLRGAHDHHNHRGLPHQVRHVFLPASVRHVVSNRTKGCEFVLPPRITNC